MSKIKLLLLCALMEMGGGFSANAATYTTVMKYADEPGAVLSSNFVVKVNDTTEIPVEQVDVLGYARFAMSSAPGTLKIEVTAPTSTTGTFALYPKRSGIVPTIDEAGKKLSFVLDAGLTAVPLQFIINVDGKCLALFVDPPEIDPPTPTDANVKNILDFKVDNTGHTLQTSAIQHAINWMAANTKGKTILFFPNGVYKSGSLKIKSSLQIYLQDGARIQGSDNIRDYSKAFIDVAGNGSTSFKLFGRGVIDGSGREMWSKDSKNKKKLVRLLHVDNCSRVILQNIILRNGHIWTCHMENSSNVDISNVKVVSPGHHLWNDSYDVTSCQHYTNANCFCWAVDDSAAIMSREKPIGDVTFSNLLAYSDCSGVRFGWNSLSRIDGVNFVDCEWYTANINAMAFHQLRNPMPFHQVKKDSALEKESEFGRIVFTNCRFDAPSLKAFANTFGWDFGPGAISLDSLEFHDCIMEKQAPANFIGDSTRKIRNIVYDHVTIGKTPIVSLGDLKNFSCTNVAKVTFDQPSSRKQN